MTPLGPGLPSLATIFFPHPVREIMPIINRLPMCIHKDEEHSEVLVKRQRKDIKTKVLPEIMFLFPQVAVQHEDGGTMDPWHCRRKRLSQSS